jgi:hypothetical protein
VTENKSLKRRVRARMTKTGERYAAARRQVLDKSSARSADEPLHGPTKRTWGEWVALLDAWGAANKPHPEIARWLGEEQGVPPWWTQDITVRYERHIGRRVLGQRADLSFVASATKTIGAPAVRLSDAWLDERLRERWLPDIELTLRTANPARSARFDAPGLGGRVVVGFDQLTEGRGRVSIEHENLPDKAAVDRMKAFWRERLRALKELLEG